MGVSATTAFHYQEGAVLPGARVQHRLASLAGVEPQHVARLIAESRAYRRRGRETVPAPKASAAPPRRPPRRERLPRPLGLAFTMYRTRALPTEYVERLRAVALARHTTLDKVLRDALRLGLNFLESCDASR
jgi:hypothetical protein